jgi:methyl-accepting chemotaxis protein
MKLSVRAQLLWGFAAILALMVAAILMAFSALSALNDRTTLLTTSALPAVQAIGEWDAAIQSFQRAQLRHVAASDPDAYFRFEEQFSAELAGAAAAIKRYEPTIADAEDRRKFDELRDDWRIYI